MQLDLSFVQGVKERFPSARVDIYEFPKGNVMIDLLLGDRFFVVESLKDGEFGISEIKDVETQGWLGGHDRFFQQLDNSTSH